MKEKPGIEKPIETPIEKPTIPQGMTLLKWVPEAMIAVVRLEDGTPLTIPATSRDEALGVAVATDNSRKIAKAEKDLEKLREKADKDLAKLAAKAAKALPDVLTHLSAATYRDSVDYHDELASALERLV